MTLLERLQHTDRVQARRYERLYGRPLEIATAGITRHFRACDNLDVDPDTAAIREIIDDALAGRAVYAEKDFTPKRPFQSSHTRLLDQAWVKELLARESFTSREAGEISGKLPHDAMQFLRTGYGMELEVVSPPAQRTAKRYRLRRREEDGGRLI